MVQAIRRTVSGPAHGVPFREAGVFPASQGLALREWLALPSTFPADFGFERVDESPLRVIGRSEIIEILETPYRTAWERARREAADYALFAPELFRGVRALEFMHGVPLWIGERPSTGQAPRRGKLAARVRARLYDERMLSDDRTRRSITLAARALAALHKKLPPGETPARSRQVDSGWCNALAPRLRAPLLEAYAVLRRRMAEPRTQEIHGNLRARHVTLGKFREGPHSAFFLQRAPGRERFGDPLEDVASLALDLGQDAVLFEEQYARSAPERWDAERYRSFLIREALDRAQAFAEAHSREPASEHLLEQLEELSRTAFRSSLGLPTGMVILVEDFNEGEVESFSELLGATLVTPEDVLERHSRHEPLPEILGERLFRLVERTPGHVVVRTSPRTFPAGERPTCVIARGGVSTRFPTYWTQELSEGILREIGLGAFTGGRSATNHLTGIGGTASI